ncbi:MAG TPA: glycosyltransferase family 39 protein [Solirubrobacteraceae bacterium]|nr:glycosyltransferase family 39 protein [Solirubrobacteraceae bacterium]
MAGLTVLAAALRFATLTHQSLWFDEAQAVHEMRLSLGAMLHTWSANEPNPPLYFVVAWLWTHVFGAGTAGVRSLSAVVGTATVPLVYLAAREMVSRRASLVAAGLITLSPFMIWYSQEAREYGLLAALCAASLIFFARAWHAPGSRRDLVWWTVLSALALLTQYFALFLIGAEALLLLYRRRDAGVVLALVALALVEATLIPHLVSHQAHPAGWIDNFRLSVRVRQVPVAFGFSPQYQSQTALNYGLLAAAVLVGAVIVLLLVGADGPELRGAGLAAGLAAFVLVVPLVLALVGHDYYEPRALIPAVIPLAVVVGAACAAPRARVAGAALAVLLGGLFVYSAVKINTDHRYQRADWNGVAAALGRARGTRAIAAYDGTFATAPLAVTMPGVAWTGADQTPQVSQTPVTVREVDVVGDLGQSVSAGLPAGVRLLSSRTVDNYLVYRFALSRPWTAVTPQQIGASAAKLVGPASGVPAVLIQSAAR